MGEEEDADGAGDGLHLALAIVVIAIVSLCVGALGYYLLRRVCASRKKSTKVTTVLSTVTVPSPPEC